ncbi:MAG: M48 family peptidase [Gammaproteobacteria bacterium]|nr:MAG: M48 family peptidase [Gammaproteobacteria bacterium]
MDTDQLKLFDDSSAYTMVEATDWRVRVSSRARNLKIQVYPHGAVEIVAPKRAKSADIEAFVAEHREWIDETRSKFSELRPPEPPLPTTINLRGIGEVTSIYYRKGAQPRIQDKNGLLTLTAPELAPAAHWPLLQKWLKQMGRRYLVSMAREIGREIRLQPKRVHIRLQSTRWGSCSSSGTISLNAAVLLRPPEEMRYVIVHELCHLQHMNHSKRYWRLVEKHVPDYRAIEETLDGAWQTSPLWLISKV